MPIYCGDDGHHWDGLPEHDVNSPSGTRAAGGRRPLRRAWWMACAAAMLLFPLIASGGFSAYGTLTSEYIYRGIAVSAGEPALQAAVDYQHASGFFAGAWASRVRMRTERSSRDLEVDYYAGYHHEGPGQWAGTITLMRYTYPGAEGRFDYDHNEWSIGAQWAQRYRVDFGYTRDLYGTGRTGRHVQFGGYWPIVGGWTLSGAMGRNDLSSLGLGRYLHWDVGASASYSRLTLDLRWYDNQSTYRGGFGGYAAGSRYVVSLSAGF
jgi:uncharacterized protein (TIGR02001 family)